MASTLRPLRLLLIALLALLAGSVQAAPLLVLDDSRVDHRAGLALSYFADDQHACDAACARARFAAGDAIDSADETPNLGMTRAFWFRLAVRNDTSATQWVLEADAAYLDDVWLHMTTGDGRSVTLRNGDQLPMRLRPLRDRNLAFPLELAPGDTAEILLRVTNEGPMILPLGLQTREYFADESSEENLAYGVFFGIIGGIAAFNLMIWLAMRDRNHLLYVLYVASFGLTMGTVFGFNALYLWPEHPWWGNRAVPTLTVLTAFFVILFARGILALRPHEPAQRIMNGLLVLFPLLLPLALFAPFGTAVRVIYVIAVGCTFWLIGVGVMQVLRGNPSARYFTLAWLVLLASTAAFLLSRLGLLPAMLLTEYGILVGSALETILLSLALAHRFAVIRDENLRIQAQATADLEQRVEERTRELDRALQARSEFLATVSHEIRTPMNGVLGITELLLDTELSPRQKEYAQIIQGSGRTLLTIINDVLDYSKIEAGKMALEHVPFRVHEVLNAAVQIFRAEAERKKLRFVTAIDPDVPPEIVGDPVRLQQVIGNLLSNAIKFTDAGEIRLSVHREEDGKLTFAVSDTGIGIDASQQPALFEAFNQGDRSMTRRFGGTGLGLAISRRLVGLMGGSISFESSLGLGTTFYFTLPVQTAGSGTWRAITPNARVPARPLRLLVVDDNLINLQVASGLLRKLGHEVDTTDSGQDAVARVFNATPRYDAVFMDCEMPGMDGYAATREIRRRERLEGHPHAVVIALTAHAFAEKIDACRNAGMDDHLAKPLSLRLLEQTLARIQPVDAG